MRAVGVQKIGKILPLVHSVPWCLFSRVREIFHVPSLYKELMSKDCIQITANFSSSHCIS